MPALGDGWAPDLRTFARAPPLGFPSLGAWPTSILLDNVPRCSPEHGAVDVHVAQRDGGVPRRHDAGGSLCDH